MSNVTNLEKTAAKQTKTKKTSSPSNNTFDNNERRVIRQDTGQLTHIIDQIENAI